MADNSPLGPLRINFCVNLTGEVGGRCWIDFKRAWPEANRAEPLGYVLDPHLIVQAFFRAGILLDREPRFIRSEKVQELPEEVFDLPLQEQRPHVDSWSQRRTQLALNPKWYRVDDNDLRWDRVVVVAPHVMETHLSEGDPYPPTDSGAVEQWRALMRIATKSLTRFWEVLSGRSESLTHGGYLRRDSTDHDLIVATTNSTPIFATYREIDAPEERWEYHTSDLSEGYGKVKFTTHKWTMKLTWAGRAVIYWSHALVRMRRLYDRLGPELRLRMPATTKILTHPKPILEWKRPDARRLDDAECELVAVAPHLLIRAADPVLTDPPVEGGHFDGRALMPTISDLVDAAGISEDTFARVREDAEIEVGGTGAWAADRRYTPEEVQRLVQSALQHNRQKRRVMEQAWAKWCKYPASTPQPRN